MQASTSRTTMLIRRAAQRTSTLTVPACCSCESNPRPTTPRLVRYAASKAKAAPPKKKSAAGSFNKKGKKGDAAGAEGGGERVEALKQYLYGTDATTRKAQELERVEALNKVVPNADVHETIMRAWQLHQRKKREERATEMQERYDCMIRAIEELERTCPRLFEEATQKNKFNTVKGTLGEAGKKASVEGRIPGLFPRQMPVLRQ